MTHSVPPQMFREGIGVVVEGTMTPAGHFESRRLMVSHSNEYRAPDDPSRTDMKELMSTTEGLKDGEAKE
jgi:cytochrome c-type biogenesis protein CcmE